MHIISRKKILDFALKHPDASEPLDRWYRIVKSSNYSSFSELRLTFPSADQVGRLTVFDIGGNKFRLIAFIVYPAKRLYIREIMTHKEYDKGKWKE
jgi:mRNA interferase HigB